MNRTAPAFNRLDKAIKERGRPLTRAEIMPTQHGDPSELVADRLRRQQKVVTAYGGDPIEGTATITAVRARRGARLFGISKASAWVLGARVDFAVPPNTWGELQGDHAAITTFTLDEKDPPLLDAWAAYNTYRLRAEHTEKSRIRIALSYPDGSAPTELINDAIAPQPVGRPEQWPRTYRDVEHRTPRDDITHAGDPRITEARRLIIAAVQVSFESTDGSSPFAMLRTDVPPSSMADVQSNELPDAIGWLLAGQAE